MTLLLSSSRRKCNRFIWNRRITTVRVYRMLTFSFSYVLYGVSFCFFEPLYSEFISFSPPVLIFTEWPIEIFHLILLLIRFQIEPFAKVFYISFKLDWVKLFIFFILFFHILFNTLINFAKNISHMWGLIAASRIWASKNCVFKCLFGRLKGGHALVSFKLTYRLYHLVNFIPFFLLFMKTNKHILCRFFTGGHWWSSTQKRLFLSSCHWSGFVARPTLLLSWQIWVSKIDENVIWSIAAWFWRYWRFNSFILEIFHLHNIIKKFIRF